MSVNTTPATWTTGEVPTAAKMNAEIRDVANGLQAVWDSYSVAWTAATTNPALGNGTLTGRYLRMGKTVIVGIHLVLGSTTTLGSGAYSFTLPVGALANTGMRLAAMLNTTGATNFRSGFSSVLSGTGFQVYLGSGTAGDLDTLTASFPSSLGAGDILDINGVYEAA